ncbi:MAG: hypothetical protein RL757_2718 [Bacteroidota bacterium]|jgi:hypothetical protein
MELLLKEILTTHIQPMLKAKGFKKKANYFYQKKEGFICAFFISIDREYTENGAYFTMQFGMYSEALETMLGRATKPFPKGYDFVLNENVLLPIDDENARYLLENTTNIALFVEKMKADLTNVLARFEDISTVSALMDYCLEHNYLVHHDDIMRYLAIEKEEEKMEKYLQKIKEKLYKIAERAYVFYVQKSLKLKEEQVSSAAKISTASSN